MTYHYEDLGDEDFQRLVQALVVQDRGRHVRVMPLGQADGGRDALDGTTVFQVKYSGEGPRLKAADGWILAALDAEEEKILRLVARGLRDYIIVTNVGGTGRLGQGTIDIVQAGLDSRASLWGLRELLIWWRDDVDARFGNSSLSSKLRFPRAIPSDELLTLTLVDSSSEARATDRVLSAYIADQFEADSRVRFEQVDLRGPTVDELFVDVPVRSASTFTGAAALINTLSSPTDQEDGSPTFVRSVGAALLLMHEDWRGNAVIVGGPGQGKSTLLQYLCQLFRARHLRRNDYGQRLRLDGSESSLARIPVRIDLRRYAQWAFSTEGAGGGKGRRQEKSRHSEEPSIKPYRSLEIYVAEHIKNHSGGQDFPVRDFATLLAERPVLLALDGLDEVAGLSIREQVAKEITGAAVRLKANAANIVMLVTTRPGVDSLSGLSTEEFPILHMQRLSPHLRLSYLDRWAGIAGLSPDRTRDLRITFEEKQALPHVRELSSNPMQLAILLHLMQRRGILPDQRTRLYRDYIQVFFDREALKEDIIADHRTLVEDVHAFLGWYLQSRVEKDGSSGALTLQELKAVLHAHVVPGGKKRRIVDALFTAVTARVICLVQRESGFEFEVQPLREYFAAEYIFQNAPIRGERNSRDDCLNALLERPYWNNVLRFFVGMLSKGEVRALPSNLRSMSDKAPFNLLPLKRAIAVQLLDDQVFLGQDTRTIRDAVEVVLEGPGVILSADGLIDSSSQTVFFGEDAGREEALSHVKARLPQEQNRGIRESLAQVLAEHESSDALQRWWWDEPQLEVSSAWLRTASDLRALSHLNSRSAAHVLSCASEMANDDEGLTGLLIRSFSDVTDDAIVSRCLAELGNGQGDNIPYSRDETLIATLHLTSSLSHLLDQRPAGNLPTLVRSGPRLTRRRRIRDSVGNAAISKLAPLQSSAGFPLSPEQWQARAAAFRSVFGDSWLLREVILTARREWYTAIRPTAQPEMALGTSTEDITRWCAAAVERRDDNGWWREALAHCTDDLAMRTVLLFLLVIAKTSVVVSLLPTVNSTVESLSNASIASLAFAVERQYRSGQVRMLDLRDALRARIVIPSPRVALLLHRLAFDLTRRELEPRIARSLGSLLDLGPGPSTMALEIVGGSERVPADQFRGRRGVVMQGALDAFDVRLGKSRLPRSRGILAAPSEWPSELVRSAAGVLSVSLSNQPSIAVVAEQNNWFKDG